MVTRTNGAPKQGVWFSADVRFVTVTVTNGAFLADLTVAHTATVARQADVVNSTLEVVLEALATRGTIIGFTVTGATVVSVMIDYAQAYDPAATTLGNQTAINVETEVTALVDAHDGTGDSPANLTLSNMTILEGFTGNALGAPS